MDPQNVCPTYSIDWEYVVHDFLEMSCFLKHDESETLIRELKRNTTPARTIEVQQSFSMDNRLIVIVEGPRIEECWYYYPKLRKIEKHAMARRVRK